MSGKLRVDNFEYESRITEVAKLILAGYSKRSFLFQEIRKKFDWDVTDRQLDNYSKDAKELVKNSFTPEDLEIEKDIAISRLEALFTMNMKIQDYRECRTVTMDRMKLMGLLVEKKDIDLASKTTGTIIFENVSEAMKPKE